MTHIQDKQVKKILWTLFGTLFFGLVGYYASIPTGIKTISINFQYAILCYIAGKYGPISGLFCGGMGEGLLLLFSKDPISFNLIIGSSFIGYSIGYFVKKYHIQIADIHEKERKVNRSKLALINLFSQVPVWCLLIPVFHILWDHTSILLAFQNGLIMAISNCLTSIIICDLFIYALDHSILRRVITFIIILDSLLLLSYGNFGFGSILVYTTAIINSLFVFFHSAMDRLTEKGSGKYIRILCNLFVYFFLTSFLFIGITAHIGTPSGQEKYMIVLGAALDGEKPSKILQCRLDKAIDYAKQHTDIIIITTGGQGEDEILPEGEAMKNYMMECGISKDRIIAETESTTTEENFKNSYEIICDLENTETLSQPIIYVTNAFHCFRSGLYAQMAGFQEVHPLAANTPLALIPQSYFRETFSLIKTFFILMF